MSEHKEANNTSEQGSVSSSYPPNDTKTQRTRGRIFRRAAWTLVVTLGLLLIMGGGTLIFLRTSMGEAWLTRVVNDALATLPSGLSGRVEHVRAPLPFGVQLSGIKFRDLKGIWLKAQNAELRMDWGSLPAAVTVERASLDDACLLRLPETDASDVEETPSSPLSPQEMAESLTNLFQNVPDWIVFRIDSLLIERATLEEAVIGLSMQASLNASASLGHDGVNASLTIKRNDVACRPVTLNASLSSALELLLNAEGSDLGFISLLPDHEGESAEAEFHLSGNGTPSLFRTTLTALLKEKDSNEAVLSASANAEVNFLKTPLFPTFASLSLESGPAARRLWIMTGQKNGRLRANFIASVPPEDTSSLSFSTSVELSDMEWADASLTTLLGNECRLQSSGNARRNAQGSLNAELTELKFNAALLRALAEGTLSLPKGPVLSSDADIALRAECELRDAGALSPHISGNAKLLGELSGPLSSLQASLTFKSDKLRLGNVHLAKTTAEVSLPHADIPRLLADLPRLASHFQGDPASDPLSSLNQKENAPALYAPVTAPLLTGQAKADLLINEQRATLDTLWNLKEQETGNGLDVALDAMEIHLEKNAVTGQLFAMIPFLGSRPEPNTVSAFLGAPLPCLDGSVTVRVSDWRPVARAAGLPISGSPMHATLTLSSQKTQTLSWRGTLDDFRYRSREGGFSLSGLKSDISVKDLWGKPDMTLTASLTRIRTPSLSLDRVRADVKGNSRNVQVSARSHGDMQCDARASWRPGEFVLEKLDISVSPDLFDLSSAFSVGIHLTSPAFLRYKNDAFSTPGVSVTVLPSGHLDVSGSWSPRRLEFSADISQFDLGKFRSFSQELPAGNLDCQMRLAGTLSRPTGSFKLNLKDIQFPGSSLAPISAEFNGTLGMEGRRRILSVSLGVPESSKNALGLNACDARMEIPFTSPATGVSMPDVKRSVHGNIVLAGELAQLWKLLPLADQRLAGRVNLTSTLSGTLTAPEVTLHASLADGRFADLVQGVELRGIRMTVDADKLNVVRKSGDSVRIDLYAEDGRKGHVSVTGSLDPKTMQMLVDGQIHQLSPLRRQDVNVMLSGSFGVSGSAENPRVNADITVEKGQIQLASLPGSDIVTLPITEPGQKTQRTASAPIKGTLNVRVRIPNQFFIRGYGLECEWKGDIRARSPLTRPAVTGNVQAVRGGLDVLGKHFNLAEGRISFDGGWPVSPMLNIVMEYEASNITADVSVTGPATKPEIALSSQPTMPQDEIISQIMFGQSAGTLSHVQALQLAAGAAELAGLGGPDVMGFGRRLLGLDVFKLNSESNASDSGDSDMSKTSLEMGTYVLDNVYVGVEQGIGRESETDAVVEIELTPSLEAQAKASSNKTEFGLEWKKNY